MIASSSWNRIGHPTFLVVGDLILDRYVSGSCNRISPEAPVPVFQVEEQEDRLGGAAAVGNLAQGLGGNVLLAGVVGEDSEGEKLRALGEKLGLDFSLILVDPARPTTLKERVFTRMSPKSIQHHLRVDREQIDPIVDAIEAELMSQIRRNLHSVDAILLSDYGKGVLTPSLVQGVIETAQERRLPVLIDPARSSSFAKYRGATLITPNRAEAEGATSCSLTESRNAIPAGRFLREQLQIQSVLITLDKDGLALITDGMETIAATQPRNVRDVAGAGDMVLAVAGLGFASLLSWPEILDLANTAAGLEVERHGVVPITRNEIQDSLNFPASKLVTIDRLAELVNRFRNQQQTVVFTNGCFDLFHAGHLRTLEEASVQGDVLIVAINSNESVRRLKGPNRPVIDEMQRARLVAAIEYVDYVTVYDETTTHRLLEVVRPDVLVKGGTTHQVIGREIVESYGGRIHITSTLPKVSTSELIGAIRGEQCASYRHDTQPEELRTETINREFVRSEAGIANSHNS